MNLKPLLFLLLILTIPTATATTIESYSWGDKIIYDDGTFEINQHGNNYQTWEGVWESKYSMEAGTTHYPYLIINGGAQWTLTKNGEFLTLPKNEIYSYLFDPYHIGMTITATPSQLNSISTYQNVAGNDTWYIAIPDQLVNNAKVFNWDDKLPVVKNQDGVLLNQLNFEYHKVSDELRFYYNQEARDFGIASSEIIFEFNSWYVIGDGGSAWSGNITFENVIDFEELENITLITTIYDDFIDGMNWSKWSNTSLYPSTSVSVSNGKLTITSNSSMSATAIDVSGIKYNNPYYTNDSNISTRMKTSQYYVGSFILDSSEQLVIGSTIYPRSDGREYTYYRNSETTSGNNVGYVTLVGDEYYIINSKFTDITSCYASYYYDINRTLLYSTSPNPWDGVTTMYVALGAIGPSVTAVYDWIHNDKYITTGNLTCNIHDSGIGNVIQKIGNNGTFADGTVSVDLQINSSADNSSWTGWYTVQSNMTTGTMYDVPAGYQKRYYQVRSVLSTTDANETPIITNIRSLIGTAAEYPPTIELLSQTPSVLYQNSTGNFSLIYGITHSAAGLNNSSIAFVNTIWDIVSESYNHSSRPPNNDKAAFSVYFGEYILRANNRNETLNFENNVTITEGNIWKWSGMDENSTELTIEVINSTYTKVHINKLIHDQVFSNMWYLDRSTMQEAPKTQYAIYKDHGALVKFWDTEAAVGHVHLGCAHLDTGLGAVEPTPANPIEIWYVNKSYNPAGSVAVEDSPHAFYMTSLTKDNWVDHVYSPHANSSYARCITINSTDIENSGANVTDIAYIYLTSQTNNNRPFYLNMTNVSSGTNVSFADTNVMWSGTAPFTQVNYTPNMFITMIHDNYQYQAKLYTADNNNLWGNSTLHTSNVEVSIFPPTKPTIHHILYDGVEYQNSAIEGQTFNGIVDIAVGTSSDPDGGIVTHNLTLHYQNGDLVTIINNTFTEPIDTFAEIVFNTTPYYSDTQGYVLRIVATDDEASSQTTWMNYTFFLNPIPVPAGVVEVDVHRSAARGELLNVTVIGDERAKFVINLAGLYNFIIGDEPSKFIQGISEWLQRISDYTLVQHINEVGESKPFWYFVGCLSLGMFLSSVTDKNPKIKAKPAATIGFVGILISSIYLGLFAIVI